MQRITDPGVYFGHWRMVMSTLLASRLAVSVGFSQMRGVDPVRELEEDDHL